jgi:hypothetical protein
MRGVARGESIQRTFRRPSTSWQMRFHLLPSGLTYVWHDSGFEFHQLLSLEPFRCQLNGIWPINWHTLRLNCGVSMMGPIQNCHFQENISGVMGLGVTLADDLLVRVRMAIFNDDSDESKPNGRWPRECK